MKMQKYLVVIAILVLASGCSSTKKTSEQRAEAKAIKQQEIVQAIENNNYVVKARSLYTGRNTYLNLRPDHNYIVINGNMARVNLAYVGRSFSTRPITAINLSGRIEGMSISLKKKGSRLIKFSVEENGEKFDIYLHASRSGDCKIDVINPRIDNISYVGRIETSL